MILDALEGADIAEIVERDDGFMLASSFGPAAYLAPFKRWPARQRRAMRLARGRVLDVGAGAAASRSTSRSAGTTWLPSTGRRAWSRHVAGEASATRVSWRSRTSTRRFGAFDTVVMFGNNLGLLAGKTKSRRLLRRLNAVTSDRGRILGETTDPSKTEDPEHLAYHERNRRRGRLPGHLRIRIRYRELATPWFDYLFVSGAELEELLTGTGWRLARSLEDKGGTYVAVLEKAAP
jgi:hypothetical protein